jgi:hypothetical protein
MASTGLPVETVNLLLASAVHFVIYVENAPEGRRIRSIREVVDTDGGRITSNEAFATDLSGECVVAYPMQERTVRLLEDQGYSVAKATFERVGRS